MGHIWRRLEKDAFHTLFDRIWLEGYMSRRDAYGWLHKTCGIRHIAYAKLEQLRISKRVVEAKLKELQQKGEIANDPDTPSVTSGTGSTNDGHGGDVIHGHHTGSKEQ